MASVDVVEAAAPVGAQAGEVTPGVEERPGALEELVGPGPWDETGDRARFLQALAKLGPWDSTTVFLNSRPLLLRAALQLAARQPAGAMLARRYRYVSISPDPFGGPPPAAAVVGGIPPTAELVGRLLERQRAADRAAARRGWLARALGRAAC